MINTRDARAARAHVRYGDFARRNPTGIIILVLTCYSGYCYTRSNVSFDGLLRTNHTIQKK